MIKREYFNTEQDGVYGAYYPNSQTCHRAVILMLGDKIDDLMIQNVAHKTHIEVTPKGTCAAAATAITVGVTCVKPVEEIRTVILDRPFVYMIVDTQTNLPVFFGTVNSVSE